MDNTNNPTEKPVASNTPAGQEQVSSVVPNGYKQRGNGSTFLIVMLIFLVLGSLVSLVYFKLDSSVGGFEDVGKQIVEFFEDLDIDDDDDDKVRPVIDLDDLDISDGLDDIDMPNINVPSQSNLDSATDAIYEQSAKMLGFDTEINMDDYFVLDEQEEMTLMHEEDYGYYYQSTASDPQGIFFLKFYAVADPEESSIDAFVANRHSKQFSYSDVKIVTVNNRVWRGFATKLGNNYKYYWFTEKEGRFFELQLQSNDYDSSLYANKLEEIK